MSLAQILYPPPTPNGWNEWIFAHAEHHQALSDALRRTKGVDISPSTPLYPVDLNDKNQSEIWSRAHLDLHNEMNSLLGIAGQDISLPDFKNKQAADTWYFLHEQMHLATAEACGEPV